MPDETYLFRVSNHYVENCGVPPSIDADKSRMYYSYFENEERQQAIFTYDYETKQGRVVLGDAGWDNIYTVDEGYAVGLVMSSAEKFWLIASWSAATRQRVMDVFVKSAARETEHVRKIEAKVNRESNEPFTYDEDEV